MINTSTSSWIFIHINSISKSVSNLQAPDTKIRLPITAARLFPTISSW